MVSLPLSLEQRLDVSQHSVPVLSRATSYIQEAASAVKEWILDAVSIERYLRREMEKLEFYHQFEQAADLAIRLKDNSKVLELYERAGEHNPRAYVMGGDFAFTIGKYEDALKLHSLGGDYVNAGFDAAALGWRDLRDYCWLRVCHPQMYPDAKFI